MNQTGLPTMPSLNLDSDSVAEYSKQYFRIVQSMTKSASDKEVINYGVGLSTLFMRAAIASTSKPENLMEITADVMQKQLALFEYTYQKSQGANVSPVIDPNSDDRRFGSNLWSDNLWFDTIKQSYLIGAQSLDKFFSTTSHFTQQEERKFNFYKQQWIDMLAPSNYWWLNPDALQIAKETKGQSLIDGMKNFAHDLESGQGIQMVEPDAFELGKNIACTPGKVTARNHLCEIIQYEPTTDKVRELPVMIIPPWINKYYILDLSPKNSFIQWLVGQGYSVFVISWINPDESYRDTTFDDYLKYGPLYSAKVVQEITNQEKINVIGYCLGGTLLAALLGYLENTNGEENFVNSATYFTTMIDFNEPGDLGVFVDEQSVSKLEKQMDETGYLDGKSMASTFSMMRSNDLIWHFVINNYLKGKKPGKFDLLYWNSDSTRMPAKMHSFYLRKMYLENQLVKPNGLTVLGTPIDLSKVSTSSFFVSTQMDHIAPWPATYAGATLFRRNARFVLGESGHIAGIINPPTRKKYGFWTTTTMLPLSCEEWFEKSIRHEGSWWPEWEKWLRKRSGKLTAALEYGHEIYPPLEDAPGTYVKL